VYCFEDGDTSTSIFGFDFDDDESGSEFDFKTPDEMLRHSPRTFFLHTMTLSLDRVLDQHTTILEVFQDFIKRQARYLSVSFSSGRFMIIMNRAWTSTNYLPEEC
jgi:hypothetical protein